MAQHKDQTLPRIEIERVTPFWVTGDCGRQHVICFAEIAEPVFHITVIEHRGEMVLWSGKSYEEAIMNAEEAAQDWNACVFDLVVAEPIWTR